MKLSENKIYYVYVYLDPRKRVNRSYCGIFFEFEPFYIGKGNGDRKFSHLWECNSTNFNEDKNIHRKICKIKNILKVGLYPIIIEIRNELNEQDAFDIEEILISEIGLVDNGGSLFNYRLGGEYGGCLNESSKNKIKESLKIYYKSVDRWDYDKDCMIPLNKGISMSEDQKENLRIKNTGKKQSKETISKKSASNKLNWDNNKEERWNKMKTTFEKSGKIKDYKSIGDKISKSKKGKVIISEEQKERNSITLKRKYKSGEIVTWNKNKKTGKSNRIYIITESQREKMRESGKNKLKVECPHCGKIIFNNLKDVHHFDNCKLNPNYNLQDHIIKCVHCGVEGTSKFNMKRYHFDNCKFKKIA